MKLLWKVTAFLALGLVLWQGYALLRDRQTLNTGLVRLHVVGETDSDRDQKIKLQVRDAVLSCVSSLGQPETAQEARELLQRNLSRVETAANAMLQKLGSTAKATVTLCREAFPIREYDSFALPSGVYESLRVTIGAGEGRNWWCVVFPKLCLPAAGDSLEAAAAGAGFSDSLTGAISRREYRVSFYFLDLLGKAENLLFRLRG